MVTSNRMPDACRQTLTLTSPFLLTQGPDFFTLVSLQQEPTECVHSEQGRDVSVSM
jgi:hypothetical protein